MERWVDSNVMPWCCKSLRHHHQTQRISKRLSGLQFKVLICYFPSRENSAIIIELEVIVTIPASLLCIERLNYVWYISKFNIKFNLDTFFKWRIRVPWNLVKFNEYTFFCVEKMLIQNWPDLNVGTISEGDKLDLNHMHVWCVRVHSCCMLQLYLWWKEESVAKKDYSYLFSPPLSLHLNMFVTSFSSVSLD